MRCELDVTVAKQREAAEMPRKKFSRCDGDEALAHQRRKSMGKTKRE